MAAHNWRAIRLKLLTMGVGNPMGMRSLHALLDVVEMVMLDAVGGDTLEDTVAARTRFLDKLYAPERLVNGEKYQARPAGFSDAEVNASFAAFAAAAR